MAIPPDRLTLLPFPQRWEDGNIALRALALPRGNPLAPLMAGTPGVADGPAFADGSLRLKARIVSGLDAVPTPASTAVDVDLGIAPPAGIRTLFEELANQFDIDPAIEAATRNPRRGGRQIRKYLTASYRESFPFAGPRTPFAVTDDSYACALRDGCRLRKPPGPPLSNSTVWGRIIAQALRQPRLAERLGLLYTTTVTPPDPAVFEEGGWLLLALDAGSAWLDHAAVRPELVAAYAARIPPLGTAARPLFAPVLFAVSAVPPAGNLDEVFAEGALYDDGFAKIVHCAQKTTNDPTSLDTPGSPPPVTDTGIQLGWDDEQLLIWTNRQIADPAVETRNAPMGVMGYRIDVREAGAAWTSLVCARADLELGAIDLGTFEGELTVEVAPLQLDDEEDGEYWMPAFFTQWRGRSLVTADSLGLRLSGTEEADAADRYVPLGADAVQLRYGRSYEFRVRLADISGGGPAPADDPVQPAPAPIAGCAFRRRVPPRELRVAGLAQNPGDPSPDGVTIARPRLGYPAAIFAGVPNAEQALLADLQAIRTAAAAGGRGDEPGVPDPDVETVRIEVRAVGLEFDPANVDAGAPLRHLYTTTRSFPAGNPAATLALAFDYVDVKDATALVAPVAGAIPIPTSRDVVVTLTPVGRDDPGLAYFGTDQARFGRGFDLRLRRAAADERDLFVPDADVRRLRAILLQPDEAETRGVLAMLLALGKRTEAEDDLVQRLGAALGLPTEGLTLIGRPARRTVFGCSAALPHVLAPDRSVIDFASKADLAQRWIVVLTLEVDRDWTWRGADRPAFEIARDGRAVGAIELPASVNPRIPSSTSAAGMEPDRGTTQLVFFDAVDPKPMPPAHPAELALSYTVTPVFRDVPVQQDAPLAIDVELPMAAPPTQTPKLVAAGLALSPYERAEDYSETAARTRLLWVEFDRAPDNPRDSYFARILSSAPDPMLTRGREVTNPQEPPVPVDPEPIRVITPGQSDDRAGMDAMQLLIPTDSPVHFLVPLPPGLTATSRELFSFFVYEIRLGHAVGWSTAQTRFGPPLRVAGVQHGMPTLFCQAMRTNAGIVASAAFATAVHEGRNLLPSFPATELWFLLYAQIVQLDGVDRRNILLARRRGTFDRRKLERRQEADLSAAARWSQAEIEMVLDGMSLAEDSPISVLAVELLPEVERPADPLGSNLGEVRVLRTSPLVKVGTVCAEKPCPWPA